MKFWQMLVVLVTLGDVMPTTAQDTPAVMDGFPPSTESQVTNKNHRDWPYSQWAFQNFGAPNNTVMVPRGGEIHHFPREESGLEKFTVEGASLGDVFAPMPRMHWWSFTVTISTSRTGTGWTRTASTFGIP